MKSMNERRKERNKQTNKEEKHTEVTKSRTKTSNGTTTKGKNKLKLLKGENELENDCFNLDA
jgi:hypothetical protein